MAASLFKWFFAGFSLLISGNSGLHEGSLPQRHPFYISVTEIDHNAKDKTLGIGCKMFTNDFEKVLEKSAHAKVDLAQSKDTAAMDKMVGDYIRRHLQIRVDGRAVSLHLIGKEQEAEATWSYLEAEGVPMVKRIDISNSLLYDAFDQEVNIMHVTVGGVRKSTKLSCPDTDTYLEF